MTKSLNTVNGLRNENDPMIMEGDGVRWMFGRRALTRGVTFT